MQSSIRIYPNLILAAINRKAGGAIRAWVVARSQTQKTYIFQSDLASTLDGYTNGNNRRRWIKEAIQAGFLIPHVYKKSGDKVYFISGVAKVANDCYLHYIGKPAELDARHLFKKGWRSYVWAAYLATLEGRPISQKVKQELTGISPQVQRKYQDGMGEAIKNYSECDFGPENIQGMWEETGYIYFVMNGKVYQRLPDSRTVPLEIARTTSRGRQKKHQRKLNKLSTNRQSHGKARLFNADHERTQKTLKRLIKIDSPSTRPEHIFTLEKQASAVTFWRRVSV